MHALFQHLTETHRVVGENSVRCWSIMLWDWDHRVGGATCWETILASFLMSVKGGVSGGRRGRVWGE